VSQGTGRELVATQLPLEGAARTVRPSLARANGERRRFFEFDATRVRRAEKKIIKIFN
jgi:hypothetical protein